MNLDRRLFLRYSAVIGLGGLLSACGGGGQASPAAGVPSAPSSPAASPPASKPSASPSAAAPAAPSAKPAASPASSAAAKPAASIKKVTFVLDVAPYGKHALFYPAIDKGYWKDAGFDVDIQSAKGSQDCVTKIASKAGDYGFADAGSAMIGRGQGAPIKIIAMVHYKNLQSVIAPEKNNIKTPKDLEGKTFAASPGSAANALFPAFAKINNIDPAKVKHVQADLPALPAVVLTGKADGALDFYTNYPAHVAAAKQQGQTISTLLYADYGLDIYNNGIIATDEKLQSDPEGTKRFVDAVVKSMVWAVENPDAATDNFLKVNPALDKATARQQLQIAIDSLMVDEVKKRGVGPMDATKMQFTLDMVSQYFTLDHPVKLADMYTNDFVPQGQIPKVA